MLCYFSAIEQGYLLVETCSKVNGLTPGELHQEVTQLTSVSDSKILVKLSSCLLVM